MPQPTMPAWVCVLLVTTVAQAQPQAALGRRVTLSGNPERPLPEVRLALNVPTLFLFDAPIERASVLLDTSRLQLLDVGERSLILMPVVTPGPQERWVLRVRYTDGARPEWAAFALVSRPPEVDARIDVVRRAQSLEECQAALAQAHAEPPHAEVWGLVERLGGRPVAVGRFDDSKPQNGLTLQEDQGKVYRFATGLLLVLGVRNASGQPTWAPTEATLRGSVVGQQVPLVRRVALKPAQLEPGAEGQVAVETELPSSKADRTLTLELREPGGRALTVTFPVPPAPEGPSR